MAGQQQLGRAHDRHNPVERCWMCGIRLPTAQLIPDGGSACADVRWYCRDLRTCTERWTASWPRPGRRGGAAGNDDTAGAAQRAAGRPPAARGAQRAG